MITLPPRLDAVTFLFTILEHPRTGAPTFLKYEVVGSTPKHLDIQPRGIPNMQAQRLTKRIQKKTVYRGDAGWPPAKFYLSKRQAIKVEAERQQEKIRRARDSIEGATSELAGLDALCESLSPEER